VKQKLTPAFIVSPPLPEAGKDRVVYWEGGGLGLMVTVRGHKSFVIQYRANGVSRRMSLKVEIGLQEARRQAKAIAVGAVKGADPVNEKRAARRITADGTLKSIGDEYLKREAGKLRTSAERTRIFEDIIYPWFGSRPIGSIKRSEIVRLLDSVEEHRGPHRAQTVLAVLSRLFSWHASRDDDFLTPIRRGMSRTKVKEYSRHRVLSDDELRAVWKAAEAFPGPYGRLVQFLLLTATRRSEAAEMAWDELQGSDWIIPASRMKAKVEHVVPLSAKGMSIIHTLPKLGPYVFTFDGRGPVNNFSLDKRRLDEASGVSNWRVHDLRRTARSIMSRAGVDSDIAERCLAHTIGGIRGVYDRYAYHREKKEAFASLAVQLERIIQW
jgi:integrase